MSAILEVLRSLSKESIDRLEFFLADGFVILKVEDVGKNDHQHLQEQHLNKQKTIGTPVGMAQKRIRPWKFISCCYSGLWKYNFPTEKIPVIGISIPFLKK